MKCEDAVDLIVDSLLDSLDDAERRELDAHLASCASCAAEAGKLTEMWEGLGELRAPEMSADRSARTALELGRRLSAEGSRLSTGGGRLSAGGRGHRFAGVRDGSALLRVAAAIVLLLLGAAGGYLARGGGASGGAAFDRTAADGVADGEAQGGAASDANTYMLLVRADDALTVAPGPELVQEYVDWASSLAEQHRFAGGNKLTDEPGRWLSTTSSETRTRSDVSGYFLITAADYDEAVRIAATSPHVRYGGTFEIRQVDRLQ